MQKVGPKQFENLCNFFFCIKGLVIKFYFFLFFVEKFDKFELHRDTRVYSLFFKSGAFDVKKNISQNIFLQVTFFLVLTSGTCFEFNDLQIFHIQKK